MGVLTVEKTGKRTEDEELKKILESQKAVIKIIGAGGCGNNTISRLMQSGIAGAETIAVNTDAQDLLYTDADVKLLIGRGLTGGLGAGADPKVGEESAKESRNEIKKVVEGSDLIFVTCGLGGGTGTGSIYVIAETAKKCGALTVGVVTIPFDMEGRERMKNAIKGLERLRDAVDTLIVIPNQRLLDIVPDVSLPAAFKIADEVLVNSVKGIIDLITRPGLVNRDFADVRAILKNGGMAMIGIGESDGDKRAAEAIERALNNPLLNVELDGARGALINISGGTDITTSEIKEIVESVSSRMSPDAKILWGVQIMKELGETVRALVVISGVSSPIMHAVSSPKSDVESILGIDFVK
ncbi:MAG: cell division protein FtsZ [Candidatus Aenigmarchaeota archaeon]|nr:cell division protein FtsZ [Candidatus Aenigmarchaeota archaeon]